MFFFPRSHVKSCGEALALTTSQAVTSLGWKENSGSKPALHAALETTHVLLNSIVVQRWDNRVASIYELLFWSFG